MSYRSFQTTIEPSTEPITTAEAKSHIRVDVSTEDTLIDDYIKVARRLSERLTRRSFITQTITLKLDGFSGGEIVLPRSPAQSVTSIQYVDTDGATQTWSSSLYDVDTSSEPARVTPAYDEDFPDTRAVANAVTVTYVAGYGSASDVPEELRLLIRLLVGHYFENREAVGTVAMHELPLGLQFLAKSYEMPEVF
jgi:uncharacterized phiE125 gp8 family phage protein